MVRSIRLAGIIAAACVTLLSGLALVWFFVQPETLPLLSTWQLAAILGSIVLPGLCLAAWQADRSAAARAPRRKVVRTPIAQPLPIQAPSPVVEREERQTIELSTVGRLSPKRRSRTDRAVHRHRRSARV
ncbi:MAG: hypothetical protein KF691_00225 [Phycisphaeraceae bacterium]|nr:hypothetical protein [Phycisphaeraceae bacterium]